MRPRNNYLKELQRRREAAQTTEAPEPEALPNAPEVRAVWLQDELKTTREQLAKEREKRQQVERRLAAIETPAPESMADVLRRVQAGKHKTWR
jgi:chromatin segregation and condensation protein Rec8/ScpA/Scc1 (kleisin family)